jgi:hypothetical protein
MKNKDLFHLLLVIVLFNVLVYIGFQWYWLKVDDCRAYLYNRIAEHYIFYRPAPLPYQKPLPSESPVRNISYQSGAAQGPVLMPKKSAPGWLVRLEEDFLASFLSWESYYRLRITSWNFIGPVAEFGALPYFFRIDQDLDEKKAREKKIILDSGEFLVFILDLVDPSAIDSDPKLKNYIRARSLELNLKLRDYARAFGAIPVAEYCYEGKNNLIRLLIKQVKEPGTIKDFCLKEFGYLPEGAGMEMLKLMNYLPEWPFVRPGNIILFPDIEKIIKAMA